ncbi:hypothetical protein BpHYR1_000019 [Brachionus plicatilis]|uniref:Uncharacterized protein n=1 Tax=Brachionus plicatilis TaxID=10195 RepID=A0A3M7RY06_BRAPC|nr:hypothetical protein BpHYR1_000019 [Brachionus plicatilis]
MKEESLSCQLNFQLQYCTNLYKRILSAAKTLQFIKYFNQIFFDGVHFTENCRAFAQIFHFLMIYKSQKLRAKINILGNY